MEIVIGWKTSKGIFFDKEKAEKKKNRQTFGFDRNDISEWEQPKKVYLLRDGFRCFELNEVVLEY